jgi:hypothetical protein
MSEMLTGRKCDMTEEKKLVHFAPTLKRFRLSDPICGYVGPADEVSTDPHLCTCRECLDWIEAPSAAAGAGVTGHD